MPNWADGYHWDDPATAPGLLGSRLHRTETAHKVESSDNVPDRFELFLLDDGQSKVEHKEETRKLAPFHCFYNC
jgi:hypothetical protein